jgi:hypothetical protein
MNDKRTPGLVNFTPETAPRTGRVKGARNKLGVDFVAALQREFEQFGEATIREVRVDRPVEFLKIIASVLPKEFEITDTRMKDLSDDELEFLIELARRRLGRVGEPDNREEPALN